MKYLVSSASALTLLAACGGGSGGGSSLSDQPEFVSFAEAQSAGGTYRAGGVVTSASYTTRSDGTVVSVGEPETRADAVADLTFKNGFINGMKVQKSGANIELSEANGDYMYADDGIIVAATSNGNDVAVVADTDVLGYNYQSFGVWQTGLNSTSGRAAAGSFGAETAASRMPETGNARYYGESLGQVSTDGTDYVTASNIMVLTDFDDVDVYSDSTIAIDPIDGTYVADRGDLDFHASGDLSGSGFGADITTAGMAGGVDGQFYGPGAQEVGGTFSAATDDSAYLGAFGASR